jgi:hypothetical protein
MEFLVEFDLHVPGGDSGGRGYRADGEEQLDGLLGALPLSGWMRTTVTPLEPHPNDPTK